MEANGVTWNRSLEGYMLLVLVLGLIPVWFFVFCCCFCFNFVNTPFIPQREPNTKYLDFFVLPRVLM